MGRVAALPDVARRLRAGDDRRAGRIGQLLQAAHMIDIGVRDQDMLHVAGCAAQRLDQLQDAWGRAGHPGVDEGQRSGIIEQIDIHVWPDYPIYTRGQGLRLVRHGIGPCVLE